jgi:hypothetical protein
LKDSLKDKKGYGLLKAKNLKDSLILGVGY